MYDSSCDDNHNIIFGYNDDNKNPKYFKFFKIFVNFHMPFHKNKNIYFLYTSYKIFFFENFTKNINRYYIYFSK